MSWLVRTVLRMRGGPLLRKLNRASADPKAVQEALLQKIIHRNAMTSFGQEHGFSDVSDFRAFQQAVPIRDYDGHRPWIERVIAGEQNVLTRDRPFMFSTTSGTTAEPKLVPVTKAWMKDLATVVRLWLYRNLQDRPDVLDGKVVSFVSPAIEGYTRGGMPIGSVSGLTYRRVPWVVRRTYPIPYLVSELEDYDHRYTIAARLALAADVSMFAAPNPGTFIRLAEEGAARSADIIRAVHDGTLGVHVPDGIAPEQRRIYQALEKRLKADPKRARELERCVEQAGILRPREAWPKMRLIGCWLGGSAGVQARRLAEYYGPVGLRDVGFRSTEATITIPVSDNTAAGVLALGANYYEFVPEEEMDSPSPTSLMAHELEVGKRYYILLTTKSGLYRYDINDIVEVQGMYGNSPLIAFIRKGRDMSNIMGEKLHVAQVADAWIQAEREFGQAVVQVQMIPDAVDSCYDLLVEVPHADQVDLDPFVEAFDRMLSSINCEYEQKRKSGRLQLPRLFRMKPGWSARRQQLDVMEMGKRDTQYKWPLIALEWDEGTRAECFGG